MEETEVKDSLEVVSIRLVRDAPIMSGHKLECPEDAAALMGDVLRDLDREVVCVINLKADGTPINCSFASMGTIDQSLSSPRELFKSSILSNASQMVMLHNHPSGSLTPSKADINVTGHMIDLCSMMGIPLADHIIVGGDNSQYFSFLQKGLMRNPHNKVYTDYNSLQFAAPGTGHGCEKTARQNNQDTGRGSKNQVRPDKGYSGRKAGPAVPAERGRKHGTR